MTPLAMPKVLRITQVLFFINAGIWLVLALSIGMGLGRKYPDMAGAYGVIGLLMLGNAGAMLLSGWGLTHFPRLGYPLGILVLLVNIPLTLTDQFGWLDLVTLLIDLALLGLMVVKRKRLLLQA